MSVKLRISVTKEILEKSKMCGVDPGEMVSSNCAIAFAVRTLFPHACVVSSAIYPYAHDLFNNNLSDITLPLEARKFIRSFDTLTPEDRVKMEPFSFEIDIPDEVINTINIDELKPLLQNHPTLELIEQ